ncbi:hypothetical protein DNTS_029638 [Danionella cerebrum]|uniref:Ig-like domain-containing protein n=1 Tax=Danionella cerebrum TaxID=2873325 RepID=A0A553QPK9_9TELE|nr:hypothetical protein DNTS_029638 [Danionella translucida]
MEGESVSLSCGRDGEWILWKFGDEETLIAGIEDYGWSAGVFVDVLDGRFTDRLKLDSKTGTLTISNIRAEHAGDYRCYESFRSLTVFRVSVYDPGHCCGPTELVIRLVLAALVGVATVLLVVYYVRSGRVERGRTRVRDSQT